MKTILDYLVSCPQCGHVFHAKVKRICPGCFDCYVDPRNKVTQEQKDFYIENNSPGRFLNQLFLQSYDD